MSVTTNIVKLDPGNRSRTLSPLQELRAMQKVLFRDVMKEDTSPAVRAQVARAYEALEERRNILRMRPAPKPIDVSQLRKSKTKAAPVAPEPIAPGHGTTQPS